MTKKGLEPTAKVSRPTAALWDSSAGPVIIQQLLNYKRDNYSRKKTTRFYFSATTRVKQREKRIPEKIVMLMEGTLQTGTIVRCE